MQTSIEDETEFFLMLMYRSKSSPRHRCFVKYCSKVKGGISESGF